MAAALCRPGRAAVLLSAAAKPERYHETRAFLFQFADARRRAMHAGLRDAAAWL